MVGTGPADGDRRAFDDVGIGEGRGRLQAAAARCGWAEPRACWSCRWARKASRRARAVARSLVPRETATRRSALNKGDGRRL